MTVQNFFFYSGVPLPVFKEIAKICHHKIFHFKAGFTIKFYFDSKLGTCHQRNRYLRNRIPRNNHLRNEILRNSHLRNRVLRNNYSRNKNPPQDFQLHQSGVNLKFARSASFLSLLHPCPNYRPVPIL